MQRIASYCGAAAIPDDWMWRWNFDPILLIALATCALLALRSDRPRMALAGVGVLAVAFVSPLCAISVALFSARAVHHVLIIAVAAPLFALALPPRRTDHLFAALLISTATLWAWHLPSLYDRALADTAVYWLMQLSLLGTAIWYWRAVFAAPPVPAMIGSILGMAQMGMLGALLTFAPAPLYISHVVSTLPWGIDQLADQQLGGLAMWVPGVLPYAVLTALIARRIWASATQPA